MQGKRKPVAPDKVNSVPPNLSDLEQAGGSLLMSVAHAHHLVAEEDQDEPLGVDGSRDEEEHFWNETLETDARGPKLMSAQSGAPPGPDERYLPPAPEGTEHPKRLPASVPSSGGATWTVSAPEIERAIHKLFNQLRRTPTDAEIAGELRLSVARYHEALTVLSDIESEIATHDGSRRKVPAAAEPTVPSVRMGDPVFCCLRSEIVKLFSNAIKMLPEQERLVVALRYGEDCSDLTIRLTLDIEESTLTRLSASASLHLRARIFGSHESDHVVTGDGVRPANATRRFSKDQTGPEAHIYMSGGQNGWLPTGNPWEALGAAVWYDQVTQSYFFIKEDGAIMPVERSERCQLKVAKYRGKTRGMSERSRTLS